LLFEIKELAEYVWISAFDAKPDNVDQVLRAIQGKLPGVSVQLADLDKVAGSRYLFLATVNALKSFRSKQPIARSRGMEILLYVAANRQIDEALKHVGVTADTRRVAAVAVSNSKDQLLGVAAAIGELLNEENLDELVDEWGPKRMDNVRSIFGIGDKELRATVRKNEDTAKAVERLAIERSAMLTIRK
jgi:tRNA threonylcarbamoyladenosine modification (KEOPS) complex Cgi121 subunit